MRPKRQLGENAVVLIALVVIPCTYALALVPQPMPL
jgi:hypothetical protein